MQLNKAGADVAAVHTWQATVGLGVVTVTLGLIVTFYPSATLNAIAILFGLLLITSGLFHLIRVFGGNQEHRVWMGISGLLLIVIGVVMLRHLHLTVGLVGLIIGAGNLTADVGAAIGIGASIIQMGLQFFLGLRSGPGLIFGIFLAIAVGRYVGTTIAGRVQNQVLQ